MSKGEKKFLFAFIGIFVLFVVVDFFAADPVNWTVTFRTDDKNPFGAYILQERSKDLFTEAFTLSNQTISEYSEEENLFVLAENAQIFGADLDHLLELAASGKTILIAANQFSTALMDSLQFKVVFSFHPLDQSLFELAESEVNFPDTEVYKYPYAIVSNYFSVDEDSKWESHATLNEEPVVLAREIGAGKLVLCSMPYVFTNFGLLYSQNYRAAERILSLLPEEKTHLTLFYQLGKGEATTPLRYFLREKALKWSLYVALFTILIFLVVSSRREQRPISVVRPPANATVEYVKTLGALYYREGNHKNVAEKMISTFKRQVKAKYFIPVEYSEIFYKALSQKAGVAYHHVEQTFLLIKQVQEQGQIDEKTLTELANNLEKFK